MESQSILRRLRRKNAKTEINKHILEINDNWIKDEQGDYVMHSVEDDLMKAHADLISFEGSDILEFGFGMGISANYIQKHNPKSHTICECHPQIIEMLKEWAKDKPSVRILEGDWFSNIDKFGKYDGIFFDTYLESNLKYFFDNYYKWMKPNSIMTYFNPPWRKLSEDFKGSVEYKEIQFNKNETDQYQQFEDTYLLPIIKN